MLDARLKIEGEIELRCQRDVLRDRPAGGDQASGRRKKRLPAAAAHEIQFPADGADASAVDRFATHHAVTVEFDSAGQDRAARVGVLARLQPAQCRRCIRPCTLGTNGGCGRERKLATPNWKVVTLPWIFCALAEYAPQTPNSLRSMWSWLCARGAAASASRIRNASERGFRVWRRGLVRAGTLVRKDTRCRRSSDGEWWEKSEVKTPA